MMTGYTIRASGLSAKDANTTRASALLPAYKEDLSQALEDASLSFESGELVQKQNLTQVSAVVMETPVEKSNKDEGSGMSWTALVIILICVVWLTVGIVVAFVIVSKRKKKQREQSELPLSAPAPAVASAPEEQQAIE